MKGLGNYDAIGITTLGYRTMAMAKRIDLKKPFIHAQNGKIWSASCGECSELSDEWVPVKLEDTIHVIVNCEVNPCTATFVLNMYPESEVTVELPPDTLPWIPVIYARYDMTKCVVTVTH